MRVVTLPKENPLLKVPFRRQWRTQDSVNMRTVEWPSRAVGNKNEVGPG